LLPDGSVVAAAEDQLVQWTTAGLERKLVRREGFELDRPISSHDGLRIAYLARRENDLELSIRELTSGAETLVLSWDGDRPLYAWSTDDTRLYVALGVGWDWQIWAVPLDRSEPTQVLVANAASIADMALSADGEHLAFVAAPDLEYPLSRHRLYVQPLAGGAVRTFDVADANVEAVAWQNDATLIIVTRQWDGDNPWILPATRRLQRVQLNDGTISDL
jgi:Tol biopolymer transport system component